LRIKEQETHLILHELHDGGGDDDDDDDDISLPQKGRKTILDRKTAGIS
jgi:hypothetical protein